jgi:hypothetical protein
MSRYMLLHVKVVSESNPSPKPKVHIKPPFPNQEENLLIICQVYHGRTLKWISYAYPVHL